MKHFIARVSKFVPVAVLAAATAKAAIIDVNALLTNPSFENGNQPGPGVTCPVAWTCLGGSPSPGFTSQEITAAQYSPLFVPDGTHAAKVPTPHGSGIMYQMTSSTYNLGDTYRLTFWIGTPLTLPDGTTPAGKAALFQAAFSVGLSNAVVNTTSFTIPELGEWVKYTLDFTPNASQAGKAIGVRFRVESALSGAGSANDRILNLDVVDGTDPRVVHSPEPSSLALLGLGLVGFGAIRRFRKKV